MTVQKPNQTQTARIPSCRGLAEAACLDLQSSALTEKGNNQEGEERKVLVWVGHVKTWRSSKLSAAGVPGGSSAACDRFRNVNEI